MNRIVSLTFLSIVLLWGSLSFADEVITYTFTFSEPNLKQVAYDKDIYTRLELDECPLSGKTGQPLLPARGATFLLPLDHQVKSVRVLENNARTIRLKHIIEPKTPPVKLSDTSGRKLVPKPDESIYGQRTSFPKELVRVVGTYYFRGYPLVIIKIMPLRYLPGDNSIEFFDHLTVEIQTEKISQSNTRLFRNLSQDREMVREKVLNPNILDTYPATRRDSSDAYDYLILTTPELADAFLPLKNWYAANNMVVKIHTTDLLASTLPTIVRNYITDIYSSKGISYVLIGGDDDVIPSKDLYVSSNPDGYGEVESNMPSDFYYSCLDGTFNYDGDSYHGEPTDGENGGDVDLIAELAVGRASVNTVEEAERFVAKTLWYLNENHNYPEKVLLVGEHLGFGGLSEYAGWTLDQLIDSSDDDGYSTIGIPSLYFTVDKLYERDWPGNNWPQSELNTRINSGVHLLNHLGHGDTNYAMKLYTSDVMDDLTNDDLLFVYSQTCLAGHFDGTDCWAEYMNIKTDHGAFAVVMNARYGWGDYNTTDGPSQRFDREFWDAIYNPLEGKPELARANQDSKEDNIYRLDEECMRWCFYELNLFGDPALVLRGTDGLFITHVPLDDTESVLPRQITAKIVSTDGTITSAKLHWSSGEGFEELELTPIGNDMYEVYIPEQQMCSIVDYFLTASDTVGNFRRVPSEPSAFSYKVATYATMLRENMETDAPLWTHQSLNTQPDQWFICSYHNHTPSGVKSWKFGAAAETGSYAHNANAVLNTPDITLTKASKLVFWMWGDMEDSYSGSAWDGGWVEISVNGGPFQLLTPDEGYPFELNTGNQPCWSGTFDWQKVEIDLSMYTLQTVKIRYCFSSDSSMAYEGWGIDDFSIIGLDCEGAQVPALTSGGMLLLLSGITFFSVRRKNRKLP